MSKVRDLAKEFLDQLPPNVDVYSKGEHEALFTKLTGSSHEWLQARWKIEDVAKAAAREKAKAEKKPVSYKGLATTTTCNGFVMQLGIHIKSPIALGQFDIDKKLAKEGMGEAWIPANSGKKPGFGDVFRPVSYHMGVSLDFEGTMWNTAESGQGGPGEDYTKGRDLCKRKRQVWDPSKLLGWVDLDILMRVGAKAPKWLKGWWRFEVNGGKEFVFIPERGPALNYPNAPANLKLAPPPGGKTGQTTLSEDLNGLTITWASGAVDELRQLPGVAYMLGERNSAQIQAFKLN